MGLRFRKTISILPGVRLNLGKSSASVSLGVPGFRKTFNTKGTVTTTVGLPGTGLYYVDTKNPKKEKAKRQAPKETKKKTAAPVLPAQEQAERPEPQVQPSTPRRTPNVPQIQRRSIVGAASGLAQIDRDALLSIHKTADDSIPWQDVAASAEAPDSGYNQEMWSYYHSVAAAILAGDIDAYLQLIYEVNPLDDLLDYGNEFTFGTDDPARMEVEFTVNTAALNSARSSLLRAEYNDLLQDYVCSASIRIARDIFALLPVQECIVHAQMKDETVLSAAFDRSTMDKIRFGFIDPSDVMARFRVHMNYSDSSGFAPVERIE